MFFSYTYIFWLSVFMDASNMFLSLSWTWPCISLLCSLKGGGRFNIRKFSRNLKAKFNSAKISIEHWANRSSLSANHSAHRHTPTTLLFLFSPSPDPPRFILANMLMHLPSTHPPLSSHHWRFEFQISPFADVSNGRGAVITFIVANKNMTTTPKSRVYNNHIMFTIWIIFAGASYIVSLWRPVYLHMFNLAKLCCGCFSSVNCTAFFIHV